MTDPDIEKKRKKRRRSARVYLSNAHPLPSPEQLAALVDQFPSDEDDGDRCAQPDVGKRDYSQTGEKHMIGNPHQGSDHNANRVSEPLTAGHQAPSTGDHGVGAGRNQDLAAHFLDLRQSATTYTPLAMLRSVNGDDQNHDRNITHSTGTVNVGRLDASAAAPYGGPMPSGHPSMHGADHIARNSPIAPNGSHSLRDPLSHAAPAAVKGAPLGGRAAIELLKQVAREARGGTG